MSFCLLTPSMNLSWLDEWTQKLNPTQKSNPKIQPNQVFENLRKYMESLRVILELDPVRIYPGHGPVIMNPGEKIREYITHRMEREEAILALLPSDPSAALSLSDIVKSVYTVVTSAFLSFPFLCADGYTTLSFFLSFFLSPSFSHFPCNIPTSHSLIRMNLKRTYLKYFTQQRLSMSDIIWTNWWKRPKLEVMISDDVIIALHWMNGWN